MDEKCIFGQIYIGFLLRSTKPRPLFFPTQTHFWAFFVSFWSKYAPSSSHLMQSITLNSTMLLPWTPIGSYPELNIPVTLNSPRHPTTAFDAYSFSLNFWCDFKLYNL